MQIIEFNERYPHYNMGFMAVNELTATEKILGNMSCLTHDIKRQRTYQEFFVREDVLAPLIKFLEGSKPKSFTCKGAEFIGAVRDNEVVAVCLNTMERVLFSCGLNIIITKQ